MPSTRPAPAARGTLARTPVVHLLLYAVEKKLAGTIEFASPDGRSAAVLFVAGRPAKARTSDAVAYLGRMLVELGLLDEAAHARSLAELAEAKAAGPALHGQMLLSAGLIDEAGLAAALGEQLERKLRAIASLPPETTYDYYAGYDALRDYGLDVTYGADAVPMIWRMLRESPPRAHVDAALERIASSPLRLARTAQLGRLGLQKEEVAAGELLRVRPMRIDELATAGGLGTADTRLLAYLLLATKQVEVLRAGSSQASTPPSAPRAHTELTSPPPPLVSVPPAAPTVTASTPPRDSLRPPLPSYGSLPPPAPRASSPRPPPLDPIRRGAPSIPPGLSPEAKQRALEISERAAMIDRSDYFSMLDVAREATTEEIEGAFLGLAKKWHPDRLPPELSPFRDACGRVFARMSEARASLVDPERREHYMRLLADGSGSPAMQETVAKVLEATTTFQKAEVCFRRNDMAQAEAFCRKALELDPTQPDYHAMLAWLLALKPENQSPEKARPSLQMLDRAIEMSEKCERAYFWRGMIYKRVGRPDLAVRDFKRVVNLNPRNIDAAREIRLYRMRGGGRPTSRPPSSASSSGIPAPRSGSDPPKADETKPGIFGRFFKKT